ncbi:DUF262 domain-containing protein [Bacillus pumilus]|uniref:DUF262 domain-containing protein n=1 Tax=Bacillus pumilus TaxID=1408 RepID=UPI003305F980
MEIQQNAFTVKQLYNMEAKGTIRFDYPLQRPDDQWKLEAKSLLIDSIARQYPIPPLYFLKCNKLLNEQPQPVYMRSCIDGKQRQTTIFDFIEGGFRLHKKLKDVIVDGVRYVLKGKLFSELDEVIQDMIYGKSFSCYSIDKETATDEEIADLVYRLNNGKEMTTQQKAKALMGIKWAEKINVIGSHMLIEKLSAFSKQQFRNEAHTATIIQTMMMIEGRERQYEYKDVTQRSLSRYSESFNENAEYKESLLDQIRQGMDYLLQIIDKKEKKLLQKTHFPMTLITAIEAMKQDIPPEMFYEWMKVFKNQVFNEGEIDLTKMLPTCNYDQYIGSGTTDRKTADGKMNEMLHHMLHYVELEQSA